MKPVWGQKAPPKQQSGGKKRRQNSKVTAKSATTQIRVKKSWWRKVPSKWKSGGGKCHQNNKVMAKSATTLQLWWNFNHHVSNCGGTLTTTYHIQGAGAPAKTKNYVNADAFVFFREKVRPFPHLAKPISRTFRKDEKAMVQMKRDWFYTTLENYEREKTYGRWNEKIQV